MRAKDLKDSIDDAVCRALEQDAQFREVRMPDKIDDKAIKEFAQKLRNWMLVNNITQADLARRIKASSAAISQLLSCSYKGDVKKLMSKLVSYMDTFNRRKRRIKGPVYIETSIAKIIFGTIKQTESFSDEREGKIAIIIGDSGHGKSVCLKEYARINPNSIYVGLDDTMTSTAIFSKIARTLRTERSIAVDSSGLLRRITGNLADVLEPMDITVMLDEASALDVRKLNQLRQVITVRCKCPLIIAGNAHLLKTINDDAGRRGYESLDQFRSRLLRVVNLDLIASAAGPDRGQKVYTADDIRRLYEYGGVTLEKDAVAMLKKICCTPLTGRLRTCSIIIEALHLSPKVIPGKTAIDSRFIRAAIRDLGLPILDRLPVIDIEQDKEEKTQQTRKAG
jgi:DNA transposition AAA+ family ATPase